MLYYLYLIVNVINGHVYVGVHETQRLDDGYMGSGTELKKAMSSEGAQAFVKVILENFKDSASMYAREAEIVDWEFILRDDTYNVRLGGKGGWGHLRGLVTAKTTSGKILKVQKDDPRLTSGELHGNTKGLKYFNNGTRTLRLDPRVTTVSHLQPGRLWSAAGRQWFNDGQQSFFLMEAEGIGLQPGRLALKNTHLVGRGYFNDGVTTFRLHRDDPRVAGLVPGRLFRSR